MTRLADSDFKSQLLLVCFLLVGFTLGSFHWQSSLRWHCPRSPNGARQPWTNASFYEHFPYRTERTCPTAPSEIFLTVLVLSSCERLKVYLPSILETWARAATQDTEIVVAIEQDSCHNDEWLDELFSRLNEKQSIQSCLFLVKLKHVTNDYPPQKKSFYAMKFIYAFHGKRTSWLLRLDDNAYVQLDKLAPWLRSIDSRRALYIGQSGSGRRNESAIEFPPGKVSPASRLLLLSQASS
jgi:hypothetical protein